MLSIVTLLFVVTIHTASSQYYLQQHNSARRQVGVSGLKRSYGLERSAQKIANYLCTLPTLQHSRKGSCNTCRPYSTGENVGGHGNIEASLDMMIAEKKDWIGGANGRCSGSWYKCGHYAQIISQNTYYVGCAVKKCRGNGMAGRVVCHYSADARFEADEPEDGGESALAAEATQSRNLTIGIVVGVAVLVVAGALVAFFCWRKKKAAASAKAVQVLDEEDASDDEEEEVEVAMTQDVDDGEDEEETAAVPLSTN